jgi:hypothetical protein
LHQNLAIVDNYIALCEKSVSEDPQNEVARDYLFEAYQQKADLLTQLTERGENVQRAPITLFRRSGFPKRIGRPQDSSFPACCSAASSPPHRAARNSISKSPLIRSSPSTIPTASSP